MYLGAAVAAVVFVAVALTVRVALTGQGASPSAATLSSADLSRLQATFEPLSDTSGLISLEDALAAGAKTWGVEPSKPDGFLGLVSDPASVGTDQPMEHRPVWILRYSGLSMTSPGGVELHFAYVFIDARTGEEIFTRMSP